MNEDMKDFFGAHDIKVVLSNEKAFITKLQIDDNAYAKLKMAKNLEKYGASLATGLAAAGGAYAIWISSLTVIGQLGVTLGLVSNPIGWIALAGGAGAVLMYGGKSAIDAIDQKAYNKTPKYLNTPLDLLGTTLMSIIMPLSLKVSLVNDKIDNDIIHIIVKEFASLGYDKNYIEQEMNIMFQSFKDLQIDEIKAKLKSISKDTDGLEYQNLSTLIQEFLNNVFEQKKDKSNFRDLSNILLKLQ